jgi:hypothetical protein
LSAKEGEGVPIAFEDVLIEAAPTAVADAQGSWGEAVDVFAVQAVVLQFLFGEHVGRFSIELSQQTDLPDRGLLGTLSLATELESRNHVLTQWGHEMSPFVRGRVVCLSTGGHRTREGSSTAAIGRIKELPRQRLT